MNDGTENDVLRAEVVIVGGGLVGGMLACALGQAHVTTVVIDHDDPAVLQAAAHDGRGTALSLSSQRLLSGIGVWNEIAPHAGVILDIRVADGDSRLFLHYDHADIGSDPFGWIVENPVIRRALLRRIQVLPAVTFLAPVTVAHMHRDGAGVHVTLMDGRRIEARLMVAADGRASPTRVAAGIGMTQWRYPQTAIVCTVAHQEPHRNVASEHFLPAGPFAILPLAHPCRSSIVWSERSRLAPFLMALDEDAFLAELKARFGDFLGTIRVVGPRFSYPLSLQCADSFIAHRLALAGDAAHGMHPIAGQGLNMGIRDVAVLAEVIVDAARLGLDVGERHGLVCYQRWRRFDTMTMLALTDGLNRLFSNESGPVRLVRDVGLAVVDHLPPLKRFFMRHAMGTVGDLPRLLAGKAL